MYESFSAYIKYMEEHKDDFPVHVYEFAVDVNRHNLDSPHSLHDAWLTSITVKENRNGTRPFCPDPTIEVVLLGQNHDRDITLIYSGVESYNIRGAGNAYNRADSFQGDIERHEVRLTREKFLIHEIAFSSKSNISVVCKDLQCLERPYT
ncbi:hypothetical protein QFX18_11455 [Saccharophagus degradans]|uniref:hypothetical protein n=1 Tax=Saccharophagus degradans TaxID=86304 RepID=UPI0024781037|nr:hypothetical protein [Saccharophagus degradans]WGO96662.1 hypothetical protein QFX18_11455 [Saccharophagus degradans]